VSSNESAEEAPRVTVTELDAVIFDLDGVLTKTAAVHAAAWKALFDRYLRERARREGMSFQPFDLDTDYRRYVDGKPRADGVRDFLASRGITLPEGTPMDSADTETIWGLGNRKNRAFLDRLSEDGVETYASTVTFIRDLRKLGLKTAIISASENCAMVLAASDTTSLFDAKVDGVDSRKIGIRGKPAPDIFLEAARRLGVEPSRAAVVEDAIAGVRAGRAGGFRIVIGIDRTGHPDALRAAGADIVVDDLSDAELVR
jgi:trehalose 6-phosphate phosphatase